MVLPGVGAFADCRRGLDAVTGMVDALQESVRQMRGIAPAQVQGAKISVCHGVGGMFAASGTIIFTNEK